MNKDDFFDTLERFPDSCKGYDPMGCRLQESPNFGLDRREWSIWLVGEGNIDECVVLSLPDLLFVKRYYSSEKAQKDLVKFRKWFSEWKNENKGQ